ncbi:hypothetical protein [Cylindrospermum sp. FACHB-282]|uniref:hypothetical protein n=1 Tax=Cylindrospermum sp. FACHB-282 TaxID=2692794 RepID=UPI00168A2682|nr:hypothetical protein [Cylindrospermum sp. FACHB-282]MBD2387105.1 hypothetical protein [Cylindrospermum sp. FACHB-282]
MFYEIDELALSELINPLPNALRDKYNLVQLKKAIAHIHFPPNQQSLSAARRRLIFDEFFCLQLRLLQRREALRQVQRDALCHFIYAI